MRPRPLYSRVAVRLTATACAAALTLATMLVATALPGGSPPVGAAGAAPRCTTDELVVWLDTRGNGAAGSTYYDLEFTNLSTHACSISGYPGVSALNFSGQQLGNAAGHDAEHPATLITLSSGAAHEGLDGFATGNTATVVLQITDTGNYPPSTCASVAAAGLRVYPPDQTASKIVPFPFGACSRRGPLFLHVEAVQRGIVSD
jgi:hypothetical protein